MSIKRVISIIADINKESFRFSGMLHIIETAAYLSAAVLNALMIISQQVFFDSITGFEGKEMGKDKVIEGLVFYIAVTLLTFLISCVCDGIPTVIQAGLRISLRKKLQNRINRIGYINFEDTDFLDKLNKAEEGRYNAVGLYYTVKMIVFFYLPHLLIVSLYLFRLSPLLGVGVLSIFTPIIVSHVLHVKYYTKLEDEIAPYRRENDHYSDCIASRQFFKETRLYSAVGFFYRKFCSTLNYLIEKRFKTDMKVCKIDAALRLLISVLYCGLLIFLFFMLMRKKVTIGLFVALYTGISRLFDTMEDLIYNRIGYVSTQIGSINNYYDLIMSSDGNDMHEDNGEMMSGDIVLYNVSFRYPYAEKNAVEGVSFTFKEGETVAVVGENGSGKTTLSKIMIGLLPPDCGKVRYGNRRTGSDREDVLYSNISAIFQNFNKYGITLDENIKVSDPSKKTTEGEIDKLCSSIGLDPFSDKFPYGYDTILSREFEGVDISGGEWQKVAIIRGKFRRHKYIFLDEPTSAIDPMEEMRLYKLFSDISKDVSSVLITHRLGAARLADRIIVMKNGRLVETGTHEELVKRKREYYRLWELQKKWYTDEDGLE